MADTSAPTRRRPSVALVIALLALVVATGGTAFAAGLAANSVGSKQVKNNSLLSKDVKNNKLTGADVKESTLRGVDATSVDGLDSAVLAPRLSVGSTDIDMAITTGDTREIVTTTLTVPVRSLVRVDISGYAFLNGSVGITGEPVLQVHINQTGEPLSTGGPTRTVVTVTNLVSTAGFDRAPVAGTRVLTLDAGTYTFALTIDVQSGTPATAFGLSRARIVATSFPLDGTGAPVPPPTGGERPAPPARGTVR